MQTLTVKLNTQGPPIVLWRAIPAALTITGVAAPAEHWDLIVTAGRTDSALLTGTVTGTGTTLSASFPAMDSAALAAAIEGKAALACEVTLTDGAAQVYLFPLTVRNRATNTTPPAPVPPDAVRTVNGQPGPEVNLDASDVGALAEPDLSGIPGDVLKQGEDGPEWGRLNADDVDALDAAGPEIVTIAGTAIALAEGTVFRHTLAAGEVFTFDTSLLTATRQVTGEVHLIQPATAVSFTLPAGILWESDGAFAAGNEGPDFSTGSTLYALVFRWDGTAFLGNLAYTKGV